jgi:hypothetical protein
MKLVTHTIILACALHTSVCNADDTKRLFMDVHELDSVTAAAVAEAHSKDLAVQDEFGVEFVRYWVDESNARVYCLAEADNAKSISDAHKEAHGLVPQNVYEVTDGIESPAGGDRNLFMDVHNVGAGKVTPADVAAAHEQDLAVQGNHGVNFVNYWVDERTGSIFCLSEAEHAEDVIETHRNAHGLISDEIAEVTQGQ